MLPTIGIKLPTATLLLIVSCLTAVSAKPERRKFLIGFPFSITCKDACWSSLDENEDIQCVISKNSSVVFNETIKWSNRSRAGIFTDAEESWNNTNVEISIRGNQSLSHSFRATVSDLNKGKCSSEFDKRYMTVGRVRKLPCTVPRDMLETWSEDQLTSVRPVWYKDCQEIKRDDPNYEYGNGAHHCVEVKFSTLKIKNASLSWTPGSYQCMIEYKNKSTTIRSYTVCVEKKKSEDKPVIFARQRKYYAAPGENVTVECYGNWGRGNPEIRWSRQNSHECIVQSKETTGDCTLKTFESYCEKLDDEKLEETNRVTSDYFISTFTIRNLTYEHNGNHTCSVIGTKGDINATFTIKIRPHQTTHSHLTVALIVVCVVLATAIFLIAVYKKFEIDIAYFIKKKFIKYRETSQPVAYLVYCEDAFNNGPNNNPVKDVTSWLSCNNLTYVDPNRGKVYNEAGELVITHMKRTQERCLTFIVILSQNLLNDNTLETLRTYTGFKNNVERKMPLIFLCTRETEKNIIEGAKTKDEVLNTFHQFMISKRNTVIHWKEKNQSKMKRHLYVALPKVKDAKKLDKNGVVNPDPDSALND